MRHGQAGIGRDERGGAHGVVWVGLIAVAVLLLLGGRTLLESEVHKAGEACVQLGLVLDERTGQCGPNGSENVDTDATTLRLTHATSTRFDHSVPGVAPGTLAALLPGPTGPTAEALRGSSGTSDEELFGGDGSDRLGAEGSSDDLRAQTIAAREARDRAREAESLQQQRRRAERARRDAESPLRRAADDELAGLAQRAGPAGIAAANEQLRRAQDVLHASIQPVAENTAAHGILDGLYQFVSAPIEGVIDAALHPNDAVQATLDVVRIPDVVLADAVAAVAGRATECVVACGTATNGRDCGFCAAQAGASLALGWASAANVLSRTVPRHSAPRPRDQRRWNWEDGVPAAVRAAHERGAIAFDDYAVLAETPPGTRRHLEIRESNGVARQENWTPAELDAWLAGSRGRAVIQASATQTPSVSTLGRVSFSGDEKVLMATLQVAGRTYELRGQVRVSGRSLEIGAASFAPRRSVFDWIRGRLDLRPHDIGSREVARALDELGRRAHAAGFDDIRVGYMRATIGYDQRRLAAGLGPNDYREVRLNLARRYSRERRSN